MVSSQHLILLNLGSWTPNLDSLYPQCTHNDPLPSQTTILLWPLRPETGMDYDISAGRRDVMVRSTLEVKLT